MKVYFWGIGKSCQKVLENCISDVEIIGFIDNNPQQHGKYYNNKKIIGFQDIGTEYDYIIITVMNYDAVIYQLEKNSFDMSKVVCYFDSTQNLEKISPFFDIKGWKIDILEKRIGELERILNIRFSNMGYEIANKIDKAKYQFPIIHSDEEAVARIVDGKCSLIRFGDGEFEIMAGNQRASFQDCSEDLSKRLREAIEIEKDNVLIGIADNYGDIDIYSEEVADGIREYMTDEVRLFHLSVLKQNKVYYNAYMFKCYFPYRDKTETQKRVNLIKRIWDQRDIVLVEGSKTRTGQGNDLLDNAKSIQRILCPTKNAFEYYQEILNEVKKISKECMILCVLGPAAKVLAYDLILCGYQVIDIGQIDMDYEWYKAGKGRRVPVSTKYVSQLPPAEVETVNDDDYVRQIIVHIGEEV